MTEPLSPFQVEAATVTALDASLFTAAVNALLASEAADLQLSSYTMQLDSRSNVGDGGIDAYVETPHTSGRIPEGKSAWQFKSTDLPPSKCRTELTKQSSAWVRDRIKDGAGYFLVLGHPLNSDQIRKRKAELIKTARELELPLSKDNTFVIDANQLAAWISDIPSLSVHEIFKGKGWNVVDFEQWSEIERYSDTWIDGNAKTEALASLQAATAERPAELRIQGPSGLGKTRLVLHALQELPVRTTVVYAGNRTDLSREMLNYLLTARRPITLVVDECSAKEHDELCKSLPRDRTLSLITMGPESDYALESPIIDPGRFTTPEIEEYIRSNHPAVRSEAVIVLAEGAAGNVGFARWLSIKLTRDASPQQLADLIDHRDISRFITSLMPEGGDSFLVAQTLALFERVGWDGDLESQGEVIASFLDIGHGDIKAIVRDLERLNVIVRRGRYRTVEPHPLAVVLASEAWQQRAEDLIRKLIPKLDGDMLMSLMRRAADLGSYGPTRQVFSEFLKEIDLFGSLQTIEERDLGRFLIQLAIISPDETIDHLHGLIAAAPIQQLMSQSRSRRSLVWALEKLAWHSRSFELAADCLLRLSLAENETYANNATGTWLALFGSALPATGASPEARLAYLNAKTVADADVRIRTVDALQNAMSIYETVTRSAEIQGGAFLEPRGTVGTYRARAEYQSAALAMLSGLAHDSEHEVAEKAADALIKCVHPFLMDSVLREQVFDAVLLLRGEAAQKLRQEVGHLRGLFSRVEDEEKRRRIGELEARLPVLDPMSSLQSLLRTQPWELDSGERKAELEASLRAVDQSGEMDAVVRSLETTSLPGSWHLGFYLGGRADCPADDVPESLINGVGRNPEAFLGFLKGREAAEIGGDVFDAVLDSDVGGQLSDSMRIALTARGPGSERAVQRVRDLIPSMSVAEAANSLFGWHHQLDQATIFDISAAFIDRIADDRDFQATIQWVSLALHNLSELTSEQMEMIYRLVALRIDHPDVGSQKWEWSRLVERVIPEFGLDIVRLLIALAKTPSVVMIAEDEEPGLMRQAAASNQADSWAVIGEALMEGEWRTTLALRPWVTDAFESAVIEDWIDDSLDRAERVAAVANVGRGTPTPIAVYLLGRFSGSDQVKAELAGQFISGLWTGPASQHYASQVSQLEEWSAERSYPSGLRTWARALSTDIKSMRDRALQMEAEGEFGF